MRRPKGFTLLELLISTTLSLVLLGGLSAFLVSTHGFFERQTLEADFQERLRYAFYVLGRDIENAGFLGCSNAITGMIGTPPESFSSFPSQHKLFEISPPNELKLIYAQGDNLAPLNDTIRPKGAKFAVASTCERAIVFEKVSGKKARGRLAEILKANLTTPPPPQNDTRTSGFEAILNEKTTKKRDIFLVPPFESSIFLVPPFESSIFLVPPFESSIFLVPPFEKGGLGGILSEEGAPRKMAPPTIQVAPIEFVRYHLYAPPYKNSLGLYREESGDNQELIPDVRSFQIMQEQRAVTVQLTFNVGDSAVPYQRTFYLMNTQ